MEQLRRKEHIGVSEAINTIARRGLGAERSERKPQKTYPLGFKIDLTCIAAALEEIEGPKYK